MTNAITPSQAAQLAEHDAARQTVIGTMANEAAAASTFADHQATMPKNTERRQRTDLAVFARYLSFLKFYTINAQQDADAQYRAQGERLFTDPAAWSKMTHGLISGFVKWQLQQGYAIGSINVRLATVKRYTKLALQAGTLDAETAAKIATVTGFPYGKRKDVDNNRVADGFATRLTHTIKTDGEKTVEKNVKKSEAIFLSKAQRRQLKTDHPVTAQGRRDALLMCLLLDHGLRCGEIAALDMVAVAFDDKHKTGYFTFYRQKVRKTQTHEFTRDTYKAARAYFDSGDAPAIGKLLRGSLKSGELSNTSMSVRAITKRVNVLGERIGIVGLSAHDGRHSAATEVARRKVYTLDRMVEMFGWNSPAMALQYIAAAQIANEGVDFDD